MKLSEEVCSARLPDCPEFRERLAHPALHQPVRRFLCAGTWAPKRWLHFTTAAPLQ